LTLAKAGNPAKLDALVQEYTCGLVRDDWRVAADFGDVSLFSVYWPRFEATLAEVEEMTCKIVIDTMNPLNVNEHFEHYHDAQFMARSSTSEELQKRLPKTRVVKAFRTIPAAGLERGL
jgi:predicted dinucleotide-binding enzyme